MNTLVAKSPSAFSTKEIDEFVALVLEGGEVIPNGLHGRAMNASRAAFIVVLCAGYFFSGTSKSMSTHPEASRCAVERVRAKPGQNPQFNMIAVNDGAPCEMSHAFSHGAVESLTVQQQPTNGVLAIDLPFVRYIPKPNFSGVDRFEVTWFGPTWGPYSPAVSHTAFRATVSVVVSKAESGDAQRVTPKP